MTDLLGALPTLDRMGAVTTVVLVALLIITDKLVWHTRLKKAEDRADKWEAIALDALSTGAAAGVRAAEVAVDVVSALPDPQGRRDRAGKD